MYLRSLLFRLLGRRLHIHAQPTVITLMFLLALTKRLRASRFLGLPALLFCFKIALLGLGLLSRSRCRYTCRRRSRGRRWLGRLRRCRLLTCSARTRCNPRLQGSMLGLVRSTALVVPGTKRVKALDREHGPVPPLGRRSCKRKFGCCGAGAALTNQGLATVPASASYSSSIPCGTTRS